jgi:hypothetical protein
MRAVLNKLITRLGERLANHDALLEPLDAVRINQGYILSELHRSKTSTHLHDYEFKVFSQWGEDGILQKLIRTVAIPHKTFIEFGVEDFFESNCRFLMMKDNWSGYVLDGSSTNIARLQNAYFYWRYDLTAVQAFITRENINALLTQSGFDRDIGILSIDLDGNDYWIFDAIDVVTPRLLILEYNAVFGPEAKISVPYDPGFYRTEKHYSNLYFGASLSALASLAQKKGYILVGTNSAGNNAFFVRQDLMTDALQSLTPAQAFTPSRYRESRLPEGSLSYLSGENRGQVIKGMPVVDVETGQVRGFN